MTEAELFALIIQGIIVAFIWALLIFLIIDTRRKKKEHIEFKREYVKRIRAAEDKL